MLQAASLGGKKQGQQRNDVIVVGRAPRCGLGTGRAGGLVGWVPAVAGQCCCRMNGRVSVSGILDLRATHEATSEVITSGTGTLHAAWQGTGQRGRAAEQQGRAGAKQC